MLKKVSAFIFLIISCNFLVFGGSANKSNKEEKPFFTLSVSPVFEIKNGNMGEWVFTEKSNYDTKLLSYLDWGITSSFSAGIKSGITIKDFFLNLKFTAGFPSNCGTLTDSDWLNVEITTSPQLNYKTSFSEHENHQNYDFCFNAEAGWSFNIISSFKISPSFSLNYAKTQFSGVNGQYFYGKYIEVDSEKGYYYPYNSENESYVSTGTYSETVINYMREAVSVFIGTDFSYTFNGKYTGYKPLFLSLGFKIAPFSYTFNLDNHFKKSIDYVDICQGYFREFNISSKAGYFFTGCFALNFDFDFTKLNLITGSVYNKAASEKYYSKDNSAKGGATAKFYNFSVSCKYVFQ